MSNWYKISQNNYLSSQIAEILIRATRGEIVSSLIQDLVTQIADKETLESAIFEGYNNARIVLGLGQEDPAPIPLTEAVQAITQTFMQSGEPQASFMGDNFVQENNMEEGLSG